MKKRLILFLLPAFLLTGCSLPGLSDDSFSPQLTQDGTLLIGTALTAASPEGMNLLDSKDILAGEGLYYATWTKGDPVPYENSDGDAVDLYEQQLYLLSCECDKPSDAESTLKTWLEGAQNSYKVLHQETYSTKALDYTILTYTCTGEDNPYHHGISAFAGKDGIAVCAEFTCTLDCEEDHSDLLHAFLEDLTLLDH